MDAIYLDNASTTFPKPKAVPEAMYHYMTRSGSNINRGCYDRAYAVEELVYETRQMLCSLFGGEDCRNVAFTKNVTESLNVILKGLLKPGDHVLVSSMEHNAVMRPLVQLEKQGISFFPDSLPQRWKPDSGGNGSSGEKGNQGGGNDPRQQCVRNDDAL